MPGLPAIRQAGLGQGHNQKKDTHTLGFDVTLGSIRSLLTRNYQCRKGYAVVKRIHSQNLEKEEQGLWL